MVVDFKANKPRNYTLHIIYEEQPVVLRNVVQVCPYGMYVKDSDEASWAFETADGAVNVFKLSSLHRVTYEEV